jgi:hypothetical protein
VFEEAAVDLGRGLDAFSRSRAGEHRGTLPVIGVVKVVEDTRRLRRLLRPGYDGVPRARIWFATVSRHRARWVIALNVEAPDLHPAMRHPQRKGDDHGFVGIDRGLSAWLVVAGTDGTELDRRQAPRPLVRALPKLRRATRQAARKQPRSLNRRKADIRLNRIHGRIADQRRYATHEVTTRLVKTHDRVCMEDLATANLVRNRHLADPSPMRPGGSYTASSPTRPPGTAASWRALPDGSRRRRPARTAGRSIRILTCRSGCSAATPATAAAGWSSIVTSTPRSTLPSGPRPSSARQPRPRTPKQEAGPPTPVEGPALATAPAVVQPDPQSRQGRSRNRSALPQTDSLTGRPRRALSNNPVGRSTGFSSSGPTGARPGPSGPG